jgi:hypothetical protein
MMSFTYLVSEGSSESCGSRQKQQIAPYSPLPYEYVILAVAASVEQNSSKGKALIRFLMYIQDLALFSGATECMFKSRVCVLVSFFICQARGLSPSHPPFLFPSCQTKFLSDRSPELLR